MPSSRAGSLRGCQGLCPRPPPHCGALPTPSDVPLGTGLPSSSGGGVFSPGKRLSPNCPFRKDTRSLGLGPLLCVTSYNLMGHSFCGYFRVRPHSEGHGRLPCVSVHPLLSLRRTFATFRVTLVRTFITAAWTLFPNMLIRSHADVLDEYGFGGGGGRAGGPVQPPAVFECV